MYMTIPPGIEVPHGNRKEYVFEIKRNLYGQKQAGRVWYHYLISKLKKIGWTQSNIDPCVLYKHNMIYILYTDDTIIMAPTDNEIEQAIIEIRAVGLDVSDEGQDKDYLGVHINKGNDSITFHQPTLIDRIVQDMGLQAANPEDTPAKPDIILKQHKESPIVGKSFNYSSIIGKMLYLEKASRPDIAYASHQCARYSSAPRTQHMKALLCLGRYLKHTRDKGITATPNLKQGLEIYVDANFIGDWDQCNPHDPITAQSRHGYIISYAGCPLMWKSQLQTEIALSTYEAEYIVLSSAIREAIMIIELLKEMKRNIKAIPETNTTVICKVFEDNQGTIDIATNHKYRHRTKHISAKYHHFREYVTNNTIKILKVSSANQLADIFTKPLHQDPFTLLRKHIMGW
jgi:hypothetical protein